MRRIIKSSLYLSLCVLGIHGAQAVHPSRGLWVGEVALNSVNEATGAVGDSNTYEFSDPAVPTATSDTAYLRLILHVNGAGQAQLLKSVAVAPIGANADGSADLVLLTNPELYASYPGIATRVASAFYDFGDSHAVAAVQTLMDEAARIATEQALLQKDESQILTALETPMTDLVNEANAGIEYLDRGSNPESFLNHYTDTDTDKKSFFTRLEVQTLADQVATAVHRVTDPLTAADFAYDGTATTYDPLELGAGAFKDVVDAAFALRDGTFYKDSRGIDAVVAILEESALAAETQSDETSAQAAARLAAEGAWHNAADTTQAFNRFLAGAAYSGIADAIWDVAVQAALDAEDSGLSVKSEIAAEVVLAMEQVAVVQTADAEATALIADSLWGDPRGEWAMDHILGQAADAAAEQVLVSRDTALLTLVVQKAIEAAAASVTPGAVFATAPSEAYTDFVESSDFQNAATVAAETAAEEASFQYSEGLTDPADLRTLTDRAVAKALVDIRNEAASLPKFQVTLNGNLEAGGAVNGEFYLPALAPTNPFLHRLHPDHTEGLPITRRIMLTLDEAEAGASQTSSYGVSRLTGTYEEELFGLHKALGPQQDIGLKTKGSFTLNRLTLVDSLNF